MDCMECGNAKMATGMVSFEAEVKGERVFVDGIEGLKCPICGYQTVDGKQMPEFMRLAADVYRQRHSLLTSTEIREIRRILGMSQAQFSASLNVGIASIKRWEMGQVQDKAMDRLLRLHVEEEARLQSLEADKDSWLQEFEVAFDAEPQTFSTTPAIRIDKSAVFIVYSDEKIAA